MPLSFRFPIAFALLTVGSLCSDVTADEYKSYNDAMRKATPLYNDKQYAAAQEPLEAAVRLAASDADRLKAYEALVPAYRLLPDIDKMLEAKDFILRHTEQRAGRSLTARDLASFLHQRGKLDAVIQRYEAKLKADPQDVAALSVLAVTFTQVRRGDPRGAEFTKRLEEVDRSIAKKAAERYERDAETAPRTAAALLKDAAVNWLEAGDKDKALAAAKKSAAGPPEQRSNILTFYWRESLGDVFLKAGEPKLAVAQFEEAVNIAFSDSHRKGAEKKLAEAKASAAKAGQ
jgi:tetratricopeptide (TPR) repeat protein